MTTIKLFAQGLVCELGQCAERCQRANRDEPDLRSTGGSQTRPSWYLAKAEAFREAIRLIQAKARLVARDSSRGR